MDSDLDTSQARSEIFKRIREKQGRLQADPARDELSARQYMAQHAQGPKPSAVSDLVDLFVRNSEKMLCTVKQVSALEQVPSEVRDYLTQEQLTGACVASPALQSLDWKEIEPLRFGQAHGDDLIGISNVAYAVAETGSLVLASQADSPSNIHLLPETHIAVVREDQIVHTLEDVFLRMRQAGQTMPRALNIVSGPSRTADIEQTIVLGAHGPFRVHLIVVRGPA